MLKRTSSDAGPTQVRVWSVPIFFAPLRMIFHTYLLTQMGTAVRRPIAKPYLLWQKVICYSVTLAVRWAP